MMMKNNSNHQKDSKVFDKFEIIIEKNLPVWDIYHIDGHSVVDKLISISHVYLVTFR